MKISDYNEESGTITSHNIRSKRDKKNKIK